MSVLLSVIAVTLFVSAMCSLFEAILYSTRIGVLESASGGGRHQRAAQQMLLMKRNIASPTSAILILNTIANTAGAAIAGMLALETFGPRAVLVVSVLLTLGILFLSEILPKTFGAVHWRTIWPYIVGPLVWMRRVLYPLIVVTQKFSEFFTGTKGVPIVTEDEIRATIHMGQKEGELTREELQLISAVFRFDEMLARQILVPRREVVILNKDWSLDKCLEVVTRTGHTRYPVCAHSLDDAIGLLHIKDVVQADRTKPIALASLVRPLPTIPATMPVSRLLRQMQRTRKHMVLAIDERGTALGIITLENVLEQIVGAVQDEFDAETPEIMPDGPGQYIVQGRVSIDRINTELKLDLFAEHVDTIAGLLVKKTDRLLKPGDQVELDGIVAEVLEVRADHATRIRLKLQQGAQAASKSNRLPNNAVNSPTEPSPPANSS